MRVLPIFVCLAALACSRPPAPVRPLTVVPMPLPVGDVALSPQLTVVADHAVVSWIENETRTSVLKFAERTAGGWTAPCTVASGDNWFSNFADVPSVVRLADGTLAAEWLEITDDANDGYDLRLSFSKDGGTTWSPPLSPHHDGTKAQHGFASLFQMPGAGLGVVWLDGRAVTAASDAMTLRAAIFNTAGSQQAETLLDDRVCDCCPTSVAVSSDGPVVAYRDRTGGEIRDIAVSRFVNGAWTPGRRVHDDNWHIAACPINGPAIAASGRNIAVAWMTANGDDGHAFVAFSSDAGNTFGPPIRLDNAASTGRVGVAFVDDRTAVASWIEYADGQSRLQLRRVDAGGERGAPVNVVGVSSERTSGYPRMVKHGNELILAWTDTRDGGSTVRTAVVPLQ